tara:strand:+ start:1238 stop:2671 length:1434 start_codon:yes stop_codon:yes gene_type:complete
MESKIIPVLLSGGSGTRLWPLSRESYPKQFLSLENRKKTLLQETQLRLKNLKCLERPIIISNSDHRFIVAEQMRELGVVPNSIILEPFGRNSAPAVAVASLKALEIAEDPIILVLPADHSIERNDDFLNTIQAGIVYAKKGHIVTFGILPSNAETGFGYIEAKKTLDFDSKKGEQINRFIEKPDHEMAERLILDKKFSWNSGIFLLKAKLAINEIEKYCPEVLTACQASLIKSQYDLDFQRLEEDSFSNCPNISFDTAVMEKTKLGTVLPLNVGWSDVGSWDSIWQLSNKDVNGNFYAGKVFLEEVKDSYIHSDNRLVVASGIENLIIVETFDAILVTKKNSSQRIKNILGKLKNKKFEEAIKHRKIYRPWGSYVSIGEGPNWQVKIISVNPGACLSLQKHNYRTEHWIVVSGIASVEIDKTKKVLKENQSTFIPLGSKHRLSNESEKLLTIIEVQSGNYLGEDDIVRYADNYGRNK